MTVVEHSTPSDATQEAQDLFEEAHRRRRHRRLALFSVAIFVIAGAATYLTSGPGGLARSTPSSPFGSPAPVITRTGLARISFTYRDSEMGGCIPRTNTPVTTGIGSIGLIQHNLDFTTWGQGCKYATFPYDRLPEQQTGETRWFKGVLYVGASPSCC